MATDHAFCPIHRIGFNRRLDPTCPQCTLAHIQPPAMLDYDILRQQPIDPASGKLLDAFTLQPVA